MREEESELDGKSQDRSVPGTTKEALGRLPFAIVLTNPELEDNPITYVNHAFELVTGYARDAVIGRNCRFLQGPMTDPAAVSALRAGIHERKAVTVDIMKYSAMGEPFMNRLMISPLDEDSGRVPHFIGVQLAHDGSAFMAQVDDRTRQLDRAMSELQHRVKNHLALIIGMIRMQSRDSMAKGEFATLARRVEALQLLYEEMTGAQLRGDGSNRNGPVSLGAYISRVGNAIAHLDGRPGVRVNIDADSIRVPLDHATQIGLLVSEVLTNALQHAFEGRREGIVELRIKRLSGNMARVQISDDGIGLPEGIDWPDSASLGGRIVKQLAEGLGARLSVDRGLAGTIVTLDAPLTDELDD